jgi:hypothetical protein
VARSGDGSAIGLLRGAGAETKVLTEARINDVG